MLERLSPEELWDTETEDNGGETDGVLVLTMHASKGLEFDSVIIMAVENEIFFGSQDENRCAFFVGVSRAKRRLILTHADQRERPANARRWNISRTAQSEYFSYVTPFVAGNKFK